MALLVEHHELAKRVVAALHTAAKTLSAELTGEEATDCLMRWGIVLATLGADVLDGVSVLLSNSNQRSANMLARALADYNVRLRYYFVQAIGPRRALVKHGDKREHILRTIDALRDWRNLQSKFVGILNQYDASTWSEELREAIVEQLERNEPLAESRFRPMCRYLEENEGKERGVLRMLEPNLRWEYKHYIPAWVMQSCFLHGDQAIVSDVIDFTPQGRPTGLVHVRPNYDASVTILFSSLMHATHLLRSTALVRPAGWMMEAESLRLEAATLFLILGS